MTLAVDVRMLAAPADPRVRYEVSKRLTALNLPLKVDLTAELKRQSPELASHVTRAAAAEIGRVLSSLSLEFVVVPRTRAARQKPKSWGMPALGALLLVLVAALGSAFFLTSTRDLAPKPVATVPAQPTPAAVRSIKDEIRSVVLVRCVADGSLGSGFYVSPTLIVTNHHVLCTGVAPTIVLSSGGEIPSTVIGSDAKHDLALLQVSFEGPPLPLSDAAAADIGGSVTLIGNPRGLEFTVTRAALSFIGRAMGGTSYLQLDGSVNPGNSGGPLLDANGNVIGVINSRLKDADGIGFAVPVNYLVAGEKPLWPEGPRALLSPEWVKMEERARATEVAGEASKPAPAAAGTLKTMIVDAQWLVRLDESKWRKIAPSLKVAVITEDRLDTDRRWVFDLKSGDEVMCQVFRTKTESWNELAGRIPFELPAELRKSLTTTPGRHYLGIMDVEWSTCPGAYSHQNLAVELADAPHPYHRIVLDR